MRAVRVLTLSFLTSIVVVVAFENVSRAEYGEKVHGKKWREAHPRQNEVNNRLNRQTNRAANQVQNGQLTQGQANRMQAQDQKIYKQEQADKARNGGNYITPGQQARLNREENHVNREDRRDVRQDAANPAPASLPGN